MKKIVYPMPLSKGKKIAVCAPSGGVPEENHEYIIKAKENIEKSGYQVIDTETVWSNNKCVSAPEEERANELQQFLVDPTIHAIIPPKGGSFLMEILPLLDWDKLRSVPPTWVLGHSDISTFLFSYTLQTGFATAHGTNFLQLSPNELDPLTEKWIDMLKVPAGQTIRQHSSHFHQANSNELEIETGFDLNTKTIWKSLQQKDTVSFTGRLIGGCLNTISILIGTPFAPFERFVNTYCPEGVIWYLESFQRDAANIYRELWQMKMRGWFDHTNGVLIGRPYQCKSTDDFKILDAYHKIFDDMEISVIYDVDIGHVPPQMTMINGAMGTVRFSNGKGSVEINFT